ncbi:hypothetical protein N7481_004121 [Penicillium waksmanii]|uniref:uncharacterized protein n=1 Tax=Penicillium waksmanii TaxID=69791 RepID=UPI0025487E3C|nr:uncharacterized protein N7481_004121 [Penicillium waksmanii]KAJ5988911.1 hypothetical protein N7481_004121 [Penicillium waksmanii]
MATPSVPADKESAPATAPAPPIETPQNQPTAQPRDDEDSDFDELDGTSAPQTLLRTCMLTTATPPATEVLDDFSKPKAPQPAPPAPSANTTGGAGAAPADFDEDAFLKELEKNMANMMGDGGAAAGLAAGAGTGAGAGPNGAAGGADFQNFQQSLEGGADAFAKQLEDSGIPPGDFLKQLLADVMAEEGSSGAGIDAAAGLSGATPSPAPSSAPAATASSALGANSDQPAESFNEAIQRTMERMQDSGNRATEAASADDGLSEDMLAQLLKAVEAGASGGGEDGGDLTKMFMGMMEQLSNKEMLYEPMKELDGKFGPWIEKNKAEDKVPAADMDRYETQARIVKQIVTKFEETGYSDEDPKCREYIWERMQEMQAAGSPPEELISNPLMADIGGAAGGAMPEGMPDCPQQ